MVIEKKFYTESPVPSNLSFDEESLFWRLRLGEGMPKRDWHKPLDRHKSWHEIKASLDKKVEVARADALFRKIYPQRNFLLAWLDKLVRSIKIAFLLID